MANYAPFSNTLVVGADGLCSGFSVPRLTGHGEGDVLTGFETFYLEQYSDIFAAVGVGNEVLHRDVVGPDGQFSIGWLYRFLRLFWIRWFLVLTGG